ncbi:hypothetical protein [Streptomyces sp. NBC_01022]|uniref:hypothetical protein n=1 Tax=Streptomyces sp. NBC_01022 TaxID=2903723 RepID=UPI002DDBED20|nr:hypothetical protein [Streptomyces sp. NBC_01022]WRZ84827.1 hypothetical protein OG316_33490 [Streptomyces sp. NBC_01022]
MTTQTATKPLTADALVARYAGVVAYVADEAAATTVPGFIDQLNTAIQNLDLARFDTDELENAAMYLADANDSVDETERTVLLKRAADNLAYIDDMAGEYRLMV